MLKAALRIRSVGLRSWSNSPLAALGLQIAAPSGRLIHTRKP